MGVRLCGVALAVCVIVGSLPVCAQETVNSASVSGRVTDPQGAVVPGAQVTARETGTNVTRETVGLYAQDEWKMGPSLTLNAGLRYDLQYLETIRTYPNVVCAPLTFA